MSPPVHLCHAEGCTVPVPLRLMACLKHWRLVPIALQRAVWNEYVPGQERTKTPTPAYLEAAKAAIEAIAKKEGRRG